VAQRAGPNALLTEEFVARHGDKLRAGMGDGKE